MWPLGHVAVAYLCYAAWTRWRLANRPGELTVLVLVLGSQFPDLVDKPLAWYLAVLPTGRTLAHSLVFLVPFCLAVWLFCRRQGAPHLAIAFAIGALSHVAVDALPALWGGTDPGFLLWPILPVEPYEEGAPSVLALLVDSLDDPYFLVEFVLASWAFVVWRRHGYPGLEPLGARWRDSGRHTD